MNIQLFIYDLIDEATCHEVLRKLKWPNGITCFECGSEDIRRNGHDKGIKHRQRYVCKTCKKSFTDLSDTVIASNHVPIQKWMACESLKNYMSNKQMAEALKLTEKIVGDMRTELKDGFIRNNYLNDWDW